MGSFPAGQDFLSQHDVPKQLAQDLTDPCCDSSIRVCVTNLLGLVISRSPSTVDVLLPNIESPLAQSIAMLIGSRDPSEALCGLNTWGNASLQTGGLALFLGWKSLLQEVVSLITSPREDLCKGAMAAWTAVFQAWSPNSTASAENSVNEKTAIVKMELWEVAAKQVVQLALKSLAAKPFPDVRVVTWHLLSALLLSPTTAEIILQSQEMRDRLLDFGSEGASNARIAKYEFVVQLERYHGLLIPSYLDTESATVFTEYAHQGPHWVPRSAEEMLVDQVNG